MPPPDSAATRAATPTSFPEDCKQVLQGLRGALTSALATVGVDPARPQDMARTLGLHRNLTWKVSKIVTSTDVFSVVPHIPGRSGMEILNRALRKAGVEAAGIKSIKAALDDFDRLVALHGGDRATLELVAGGFVPEAAQGEALVSARKAAFRGNSATWSVQARVLLSLNIMAPSAEDPRRVDLAQVRGLIDLRRLRPDVGWPLFRRQAWDESGLQPVVDGVPIGKDEHSAVPLLRDFCSPDLPELNVVHLGPEVEIELPPGEVGRTGEQTCIYGVLLAATGSQYAEGEDRICELGCNLSTPVELMHSDLLVHESLTWAMRPRTDVYGLLHGGPMHDHARRSRFRLPIETEVHELGRGLATMATPHVPRYLDLLSHVFDALGWDETRFRGFRHLVEYPPIPAVALMAMDLLPEEG